MNKKTLTKLEFYKITELLMNEATTPGGQRKCRSLCSARYKFLSSLLNLL